MSERRKASKPEPRTNNESRRLILQYFYDRNKSATSPRGKKGYAVKISDAKKELKAAYGLAQQEVIGNLNYLMSQGWIEEEHVEKSVPLPSGTIIPQSTSYYKITAAGIDKVEGPGEFTMEKFSGIKIEATGRNIITVGDGNQVNAVYADAASALVDLRQAVLGAEVMTEAQKMDAIADIESIESQLVKSTPNSSVIRGAWDGLRNFDTVLGVGEKIGKAAALLAPFL